jgi:hypothetical protein
LTAGALPATTLPDLFRRRQAVQRKHVLRTIAFEAGCESWEEYRPALARVNARQVEHLSLLEQGPANLRLWFSSESEAIQSVAEHGGRAVRAGVQAVVLPASTPETSNGRSL